MHRDLKCANILLLKKPTIEIRVIDFGLAISLDDPEAFKSTCGTAGYFAPEILATHTRCLTSDIFSLGVVFFHLYSVPNPIFHRLTGKALFPGQN
jgi:serine/threonine protein kinase